MTFSDPITVTAVDAVLYNVSSPGRKVARYSGNLNRSELIFKLSGRTTVRFGEQIFHEEANTLRFLPETTGRPDADRIPYRVDSEEPGECIYLCFHTARPLAPDAFTRQVANPQPVAAAFFRMLRTWQGRAPGYRHRVLSELYGVFALLAERENSYLPQNRQERIRPGVEYLEAHFLAPDFDYGALSRLSGVSQVYFNRLFRQKFAQSPSEYLARLRIAYACDLLRSGRCSVAETAARCGYPDAAYFSRAFKRQMGHSPRAYLREQG